MPSPSDFEKLGVFYVGSAYDLDAQKRDREDLVLYDSKDLVTHAVCVGMTGSGKTGLCLGLLEEAAIDGIPAIIIDPKGDLSNLLLTFPELRPADFRPWINESDARTKGQSPDEFAAAQAALWSKGLADWGQDGPRIARLKQSAEFVVYTPGSSAGVPVSVLKSFAPPGEAVMQDAELLRERIGATATSLLALVGVDADPAQSREHILLSAIFASEWGQGRSLDLPALIERIQQPGFDKLGVMSLETVFPSKERFGLAMQLNNLVASPGFQAWSEGVPLDVQNLLYTLSGKPRHAIFSIAHLPDAERMFFVALLLNQVLSWTRSQSGTTSLRAIVYMDEIAGYFPPSAMPPSKKPLLTLMKQARAFGVGVVLATQNPVDLDYKGLANAGTWFIGRLQTDRDKQRVLDGLEGAAAQASAKFDRATMDRLLSRLGPRVFLMNNVHDDEPRVLQSRWCLSYLRGPMTREQIKSLMDPVKAATLGGRGGAAAGATDGASATASAASAGRPALPPEIPQYFIPARAIDAGSRLEYRPMLMGLAKVYYVDAKAGVDQDTAQTVLCPLREGAVVAQWDDAQMVDMGESDLERQPEARASFAPLPGAAASVKSFTAWQKDCVDALFKVARLELISDEETGLNSLPGEKEREFRLRLAQAVREERDAAKEKLRQKYGPKLAALQERLRKSQAQAEVQKQQSTGAKIQAAVSVGAAILGAFMGRKTLSVTNVRSAGSALGRVEKTFKESGDVGRAMETVEAVQQQLSALDEEFNGEISKLDAGSDPMTRTLTKAVVKPKKTNIKVRALVLAWAPHEVDGTGEATPAW